MMSFRGNRLAETQLPLGTVWLLEKLAESKGKQALCEKQSPQILRALREMALVESTESSNRIEGVTVERERLRPLILGNARPRDRSEVDSYQPRENFDRTGNVQAPPRLSARRDRWRCGRVEANSKRDCRDPS